MAQSWSRWLLGAGIPVIVAAAGVGGWFLYDNTGDRARGRAEIIENCQGLVDPDAVMGFGMPRVEAGATAENACILRRAGTFEGQEQMDDWVSVTVVASKDAEPGGSRFDHEAFSVTAVARCTDPAGAGGVTVLRATAAGEGDGRGGRGRGLLSELAREAVLRAAAKAGCETTMPPAPKD
ncbi:MULTISPECIES: hypothetical protein [unclassified Streptomyces]|uniref:hypothetical protein n=1 Tax=unclassified Streptomyces TaxID=2593676 RepID=UPI00202E2993|nr:MULTISPECIES: hypothetical protein [unclassified Streptomyces]MCM1975950.1 hypothetical protein [Streptomyces sp. G1]MCX5124161.1 hypothetical protein [Streptomyces sp. NBC_00347]